MHEFILLQLHCKLFSFEKAGEILDSINLQYDFYQDKNYWSLLIQAALRTWGELGDKEKISSLISRIENDQDAQRNCANLSYIVGRILFEKKDINQAYKSFQESIQLSQSIKQKNQARFGIAITNFYLGHFDLALENLRSIVIENGNLEFEITQGIWMCQVEIAKERFSAAEKLIKAVKEKCLQDRNIYLLIKSYVIEIELYNLQSRFDISYKLMNQVKALLPPHIEYETTKIINRLDSKFRDLNSKASFKLVETENKIILKCPNGLTINMTSHHQLLTLLNELIHKKGQIISKEKICELLWDQEYHPLNVDNKIYLTVKRLRKLLGDNTQEPVFILQKNDGYYFNPNYHFTRFQHNQFDENSV